MLSNRGLWHTWCFMIRPMRHDFCSFIHSTFHDLRNINTISLGQFVVTTGNIGLTESDGNFGNKHTFQDSKSNRNTNWVLVTPLARSTAVGAFLGTAQRKEMSISEASKFVLPNSLLYSPPDARTKLILTSMHWRGRGMNTNEMGPITGIVDCSSAIFNKEWEREKVLHGLWKRWTVQDKCIQSYTLGWSQFAKHDFHVSICLLFCSINLLHLHQNAIQSLQQRQDCLSIILLHLLYATLSVAYHHPPHIPQCVVAMYIANLQKMINPSPKASILLTSSGFVTCDGFSCLLLLVGTFLTFCTISMGPSLPHHKRHNSITSTLFTGSPSINKSATSNISTPDHKWIHRQAWRMDAMEKKKSKVRAIAR